MEGAISGVVLRRNPEPAAAKSDDPISLPFDLVSSLRDTFIGANLISNFGVSATTPRPTWTLTVPIEQIPGNGIPLSQISYVKLSTPSKPGVGTYVIIPLFKSIDTVPFTGEVITFNVFQSNSPSTLVSFERTSIVTGVLMGVSKRSDIATGASFTALTVKIIVFWWHVRTDGEISLQSSTTTLSTPSKFARGV